MITWISRKPDTHTWKLKRFADDTETVAADAHSITFQRQEHDVHVDQFVPDGEFRRYGEIAHVYGESYIPSSIVRANAS